MRRLWWVILLLLVGSALGQQNTGGGAGGGGGSGGTITPNVGNAGAITYYPASAGSTTVNPDPNFTDASSLLSYTGASGIQATAGPLIAGTIGTTAGVVQLNGATSGSATVTAPAIAGTRTNPIQFSNAIQLTTAAGTNVVISNSNAGSTTGILFTGAGQIGLASSGTNCLNVNVTFGVEMNCPLTDFSTGNSQLAFSAGLITTQGTGTPILRGANGLQAGVAGTTTGVLTLAGGTSGTATITAPAVAGTATNPFVFSNTIQAAIGTSTFPAYGFTGVNSGVTGLVGTTSNGGGIIVQVNTSDAYTFTVNQGFVAGTVWPFMWANSAGVNGTLTIDTSLDRGAAGIVCIGKSATVPDCTGTLEVGAGALATPSLALNGTVDGFYQFGTHQIGIASNGYLVGNFNNSAGMVFNGPTFINWQNSGSGTGTGGAGTTLSTDQVAQSGALGPALLVGQSISGSTSIGANANNGFVYANGGHGVIEVATAAITGPAPVKADTANANQVVVTTTSDTGSGVVIGVVVNSPGAAGNAKIIQVGIVPLVLGTGTCSIGNFVIVDTTTNGRVKCTGTYSAGTVIGVAMAADSTVGTGFNTLVGLR